MGKQLELFPAAPPDANDKLNAQQAAMRRAARAREATRPRGRHGRHRFVHFDAERFASSELDE